MVDIPRRIRASATAQDCFGVKYCLDTTAYTARGLRLLRPYRLQDPHDHPSVDVAHPNVPDNRIRVCFERIAPLLDMFAISPLRFARADKSFGGFAKRRIGIRRYIEQLSSLLLTPREDGIDQIPHHIAVSGGQFPRLAKRYPRERTKSHLPHVATQFEPEHP